MDYGLMFSVIVVTYNQENYISQTLDSILNQEHIYEYEIIIGEDCSSDNTKKIVEEYATKYPNIIKPYYNNPNKGLIKNYFETIVHCKGKYIMACAGDDWWLPGKAKTQIEFMETHSDVGMSYGRTKVFLQSESKFGDWMFGHRQETFDSIIDCNNIPALTSCMRRVKFEEYVSEIKPLEKDWLMEDLPMWLWFSVNSKIHFIDEPLAAYRVLPESVSHSEDLMKDVRFYSSVDDIRNYFHRKYKNFDYDYHAETAWKYVQKNIYPRKVIVDEFRKANFLSKKDKRHFFIAKNPVLFFLYRFRKNAKSILCKMFAGIKNIVKHIPLMGTLLLKLKRKIKGCL